MYVVGGSCFGTTSGGSQCIVLLYLWCMFERFGVQLLLQYSAVDLISLVSAMSSLNVKTLSCVTPRIFTLLV